MKSEKEWYEEQIAKLIKLIDEQRHLSNISHKYSNNCSEFYDNSDTSDYTESSYDEKSNEPNVGVYLKDMRENKIIEYEDELNLLFEKINIEKLDIFIKEEYIRKHIEHLFNKIFLVYPDAKIYGRSLLHYNNNVCRKISSIDVLTGTTTVNTNVINNYYMNDSNCVEIELMFNNEVIKKRIHNYRNDAFYMDIKINMYMTDKPIERKYILTNMVYIKKNFLKNNDDINELYFQKFKKNLKSHKIEQALLEKTIKPYKHNRNLNSSFLDRYSNFKLAFEIINYLNEGWKLPEKYNIPALQIKDLPLSEHKENLKKEKCVICIDNISKDNIILKCSHIFHIMCLEKYILEIGNCYNNCPNCRAPIKYW